ncbi:DUF2243 domain-containing protein [Polyangium spumosum]|uniref:DUF2243 domain-containing protein n=1 Tax=Polyangium spumosum TaxID=889282 RepID=A0A6N7PXJ2_9BACT|nr:DUF2243 domain-containing protein [Polyangium spumosum]MRG96237.1 DUF2243 domain-containing protein [Polyangium spumosum]
MERVQKDGGLVAAGVLLGVGLGGFVDGIVFHQILQWHNMLSSILPPTNLRDMKVNMVFDGVFHAVTWVTTAIGLGLLWRGFKEDTAPRSTPTFVGALSLGWGLFNFVEGLIDHQLFGIHHVKPGPNELAWDIGFLVSGLVLGGLGWLLIRMGRRALSTSRTRSSST